MTYKAKRGLNVPVTEAEARNSEEFQPITKKGNVSGGMVPGCLSNRGRGEAPGGGEETDKTSRKKKRGEGLSLRA